MKPAWLNPDLYPFAPQTFRTPSGVMSYLDEGSGPPVVMVHGTPTWSFLYRHFVKALSGRYRCVVPDHLGFGLSDKPEGFSFTPRAHAENLASLLDYLDLKEYTLVVHDYGGPIGLGAALEHPERVRALVIIDTWLWSNAGTRSFETVGKVAASPVGRFLYRRLNFSPRVLLPQGFADKSKLTKETHRHYLAPFPTPSSREAAWVLARELTASGGWYDLLYARLDTLDAVPTLLLWGSKDPFFPQAYLRRWRETMPHAEVAELASVGHFVPEEAQAAALDCLRPFLRKANGMG
jgi:pimeloyl-ACP methyl ester carboxylesterase